MDRLLGAEPEVECLKRDRIAAIEDARASPHARARSRSRAPPGLGIGNLRLVVPVLGQSSPRADRSPHRSVELRDPGIRDEKPSRAAKLCAISRCSWLSSEAASSSRMDGDSRPRHVQQARVPGTVVVVPSTAPDASDFPGNFREQPRAALGERLARLAAERLVSEIIEPGARRGSGRRSRARGRRDAAVGDPAPEVVVLPAVEAAVAGVAAELARASRCGSGPARRCSSSSPAAAAPIRSSSRGPTGPRAVERSRIP